VINILMGDPYLRRCIEALLAQRNPPLMEIIVPFCPAIDDVDDLCAAYPSVRFVVVDGLSPKADPLHPGLAHLIYDRRRAVGLAAARGQIIALTEDQMIPDPDWCAALAEAHRTPYAAIGGAVENAGEGALHGALYLCDFGRYQRPFSGGEATFLTDQNVSYKRGAIERIRHVWSEFYHEPTVHSALRDMGEKLWLTPSCVVRLDRGKLALPQQLRERFAWGRVFGGKRAQRVTSYQRAVLLVLSPAVPALILGRRMVAAYRKGQSLISVLTTLPAISVMALSWGLGEATGYLTAKPFDHPGIKY
jgi:hypothetical protein